MSSATRLLVLGAVRILQPVHGYDVRRELVSWRIEDIANVKPGSVYGALRTLEKDGCIAVRSRETSESRPEKTTYVLTSEGEKEYQLLLRETWWTVRGGAEPLIPGLCLMTSMPRDELIRALQARVAHLEGDVSRGTSFRATIRDGATGAEGDVPEHVREILDFETGRARSEIDWARTLIKRLRAGAYSLVGDDDAKGHG